MKLRIVKKNNEVKTPVYATKFSAGMDLHANIKNSIDIMPGDNALISTGLLMQPEEGYCIKLYPRSGLAYKLKISLGNCVGVIDRDYSNEVMAILQNNSNLIVTINPNDRICQMIVEKVEPVEIIIVNELPELLSDRDGGFGSTG